MDYLKINQTLWNHKVETHYKSDFYNVEALIGGKSSLNSIELDLLGNVKDKSILHLQCHFGMDTISLARLGANVTGVDFSDKAIDKAIELNNLVGTKAKFIQSDVYDLPNVLDEKYDVVYTSYGVIGWLPDMERWAKVISHFLKPGGEFVFVEFHPIVWMFSYDFQKIEFKYMDNEPIVEEIVGTYADREASLKDQSISWNHSLSIVISALLNSGLTIRLFKEYNYSPYNCFDQTIEVGADQYKIKGLEDKIPLVYSLKAQQSLN